VATAAFAIVPLFFVSIPQPPARQQAPAQVSLFSDVREGFSYIWGWKGVVIVLVVATLINMAIHPGMSLLPILVSKGFGGEALQLAWLNSGWGFGMIAGGLALSLWGGFKRRILTGLMGLVGMGLGLGLVGLAPVSALWVALTGMAIAGFMNPICNGPFFAILQDVVEPEMQGRVFTVVTSLSGAAAPIGMAIAGPVADRFGVQAWFVAGGLLCATMGLGLFFVPAVMNLEHGRTQAPEAVAAPARAD